LDRRIWIPHFDHKGDITRYHNRKEAERNLVFCQAMNEDKKLEVSRMKYSEEYECFYHDNKKGDKK